MDSTPKKSGWKWWLWAIFLLALANSASHYGATLTRPTVKDIARQASGQAPVPANEDPKMAQIRVLLARILSLHQQKDIIIENFSKTPTGSHLLQPETFSSPKVAAQSLSTVVEYCRREADLNQSTRQAMQELQNLDSKPTDASWLYAQFDAGKEWCSATESLYELAADPAQQIHLKNGHVVVSHSVLEKFNERVDRVNAAADKLDAVNKTFREHQAALRQKYGVTAADMGLKD